MSILKHTVSAHHRFQFDALDPASADWTSIPVIRSMEYIQQALLTSPLMFRDMDNLWRNRTGSFFTPRFARIHRNVRVSLKELVKQVPPAMQMLLFTPDVIQALEIKAQYVYLDDTIEGTQVTSALSMQLMDLFSTWQALQMPPVIVQEFGRFVIAVGNFLREKILKCRELIPDMKGDKWSPRKPIGYLHDGQSGHRRFWACLNMFKLIDTIPEVTFLNKVNAMNAAFIWYERERPEDKRAIFEMARILFVLERYAIARLGHEELLSHAEYFATMSEYQGWYEEGVSHKVKFLNDTANSPVWDMLFCEHQTPEKLYEEILYRLRDKGPAKNPIWDLFHPQKKIGTLKPTN